MLRKKGYLAIWGILSILTCTIVCVFLVASKSTIIPMAVAASQPTTDTSNLGDDYKKAVNLPLNEKGNFDEITVASTDITQLTKADGSGWHLAKNETLTLKYKLNLKKVEGSDKENGEWMEIGYFKDGISTKGMHEKQKEFEYTIVAESDGEYFPYFTNQCAGYIVVTNIQLSE